MLAKGFILVIGDLIFMFKIIQGLLQFPSFKTTFNALWLRLLISPTEIEMTTKPPKLAICMKLKGLAIPKERANPRYGDVYFICWVLVRGPK